MTGYSGVIGCARFGWRELSELNALRDSLPDSTRGLPSVREVSPHPISMGEAKTIMKRYTFGLAALLMWSGLVAAQSETEIRDRIVGTWKLVSTEQTLKDGTTRPYPQYGPHGKGFLMYSRDGYMCANLANPDRPKWTDYLHPTAEEKIATVDNTFAYCGRYEIDVKQNRIVHLPEIATGSGYEGSRQIRPYTFDAGRLVLSDIETKDPVVVRWKIVWEKVR